MEIKLLPSAGRVTGWRMQLSFKGHSFPSVDILNMVFSHDFGGGGFPSTVPLCKMTIKVALQLS